MFPKLIHQHYHIIELHTFSDNESVLISVNVPHFPKTKYQLKKKNRKLRKELATVRRQYQENVYKVVENFKR